MAALNRMELCHRIEQGSGGTTQVIELAGVPHRVTGPRRLYWTVRGHSDLAPPPVLDAFVWGLLLPLAAAGGELRVRGPMSRLGLFNALRLLELRQATSPGRYRPLRIVPDALIALPPPPAGERSAVLAFSGGLDSTHAAIRHAGRARREDGLDLKALVMVFGFDAALDRPEVFARMLARARPLSDELGVPLVAVETNSKQLAPRLWPQTSTPLAATALSLFWPEARIGIFGGGLTFNANFLPMGHQPLFDQCCSGDAFTLVTDSAALSRKQKLCRLAAEPVALAGLRVCWQGKDVSRNCGRCAKCLQTMMNLRSARIELPGAFEAPFSLDRLRQVVVPTLYDVRDLAEACWRDIRDDPSMTEEAQTVRDMLSAPRPQPDLVAATVTAAGHFLPFRLAELIRQAWQETARFVRRVKGRGRRMIRAQVNQ